MAVEALLEEVEEAVAEVVSTTTHKEADMVGRETNLREAIISLMAMVVAAISRDKAGKTSSLTTVSSSGNSY